MGLRMRRICYGDYDKCDGNDSYCIDDETNAMTISMMVMPVVVIVLMSAIVIFILVIMIMLA